MQDNIFRTGTFTLGCNYWASHAGTAMWSDWRPDVVDADFARIAAAGLQLVRLFPLWPDFQPLQLLCGERGKPFEMRQGEIALSPLEEKQAGVVPEMMARFRLVVDLAAKHGLQIAVSLLNGWMSGRLFVPPGLAGRELLTDPEAIHWETRYVRHFVRAMKDHPAIVAWSPGNECNCMGHATRHQAWLWMNTIVNAIRAEDPVRPITSGMHSLVPAADDRSENKHWTIQDQGELADFLCTHPYPEFTPHAMLDPVNEIKNCFHAVAESHFYGDIGGKPCLTEEIGTLADMVAGEQVKADYIRNTMFNLWAHDNRALLWWCACEQTALERAPYDWNSVERELGLFSLDGSAKPVTGAMSRFRKVVEGMPFAQLPSFRRQAVCLLSFAQDNWANAWSSFILAKQAGFDLEFQYAGDLLKPSDLYLLPGLSGCQSLSRRAWLELLEQVDQGATLYVSLDQCIVSSFNQIFGVEAQQRGQRRDPVEWQFGGHAFSVPAPLRTVIDPKDATVLAMEKDGNPLFLRSRRGKGTVYLLTVPLERWMAATPGSFTEVETAPYYQHYREFAMPWLRQRLLLTGSPLITATEHPFGAQSAVVIMVNNQPRTAECRPQLHAEWRVEKALYGEWRDGKAVFAANDAVVLQLKRG